MKNFNYFDKFFEQSRTLRRVGMVLVMCLTLCGNAWGTDVCGTMSTANVGAMTRNGYEFASNFVIYACNSNYDTIAGHTNFGTNIQLSNDSKDKGAALNGQQRMVLSFPVNITGITITGYNNNSRYISKVFHNSVLTANSTERNAHPWAEYSSSTDFSVTASQNASTKVWTMTISFTEAVSAGTKIGVYLSGGLNTYGICYTPASSGYTLTASPTVINPMTESSKTGAITTTITNSPVTGITSGTTTSTSSNTFTVAKATPVTVTAPTTVAGTFSQCDECTYRFDSWENIPASVTADVSNIHAKYNTTYTISFKETDESAVDGISSTYYVYGTGKAVSSYPTPTKSGFNFNGWYQEYTLTNAATNIGTTAYGNVTVYAKWTEVCADPTLLTNGAGTTTTQTVSWTAGGSETEWDVYLSESSSTPADNETPTASPDDDEYTFTGLTAGTTYYWWVRAKCSETSKSDWVAGTSFTTRYCDEYSFHYGPNGGSWETPICFTQVGETHEWNIENFTIPSHANGEFWVGYAGATNGQSVTKRWTDGLSDTGSGIMNGAMVLLPTNGSIVGQASGATGTLSIWDNSSSKNQYVGFKPDGYAIMYGGNNYAFSETATSNVWETDLLTLPDVSTTYQVGIKTASSYTTCSHSKSAEALSAPGNTMRKNGKKMIYLVPGVWRTGANNEHMAVWDATKSEWGNGGEFLTWNSSTNKYEGYVSGSAETIVFVRVDVNESSPTWTDGKWHNKTSDITLNLIDNQFSITGWGSSTSTYTQAPYSHPATGDNGKFRMYDNSNDANWYVHWIPYYKLSYDGNGGTGSVAAQYRNSELSTSPLIVAANGFTREGWRFAGWNTNKYGTGTDYAPGDNIDITGDQTLYAKWERDIYLQSDVSWWYNDNAWFAVYCFDSEHDTNYKWVSMSRAEVCSSPAVYKVALPGNNFDKVIFCRMKAADTETLSWDNKDNQTSNIAYPSLVQDKFTITNGDNGNACTGKWGTYSAPTYTITFAGNGNTDGSMSNIGSIACDADQAITANAFTKTGYSFAGWTANVNVTIDDKTVTAGSSIANNATIQNIRGNITLTAQWTIDTHTVTYYANGGSGTTADGSSPYNYGSTVTTISNSFTNSGYKFKWWNTASNGSGEDFYVGEQFTIEEDADLYAQWEEVDDDEEFWCGSPKVWHATTHDVTVGDMNIKPQDYESNDNMINDDFTGGNKEYTIVNATGKRAVVMAIGADDKYVEIHFTDGSPINSLEVGVAAKEGTDPQMAVLYSTESDFSSGEYYLATPTVPTIAQTSKQVTTVNPDEENKYTYVRIYSKIKTAVYSGTGGSGKKLRIYSIKAKKGTIMRTITGAVSPAGYGTVSPSSISIEDGSEIDIDDDELTCDGKTLTATPTSDGVYYTYSFSSWSGTGVSDGATVSGDLTATANFTRTAVKYSLAWDKNGSGDALSGSYTSGSTAYDATLTAPNTPTWAGHTFSKWNTAENGSGDDYTGSMPAANTTYYAQWTANKYDVEVTLTDATQESGDTGEDKATHATDYVATFEAESGYKLPNDVTVNIGESKASKGTEYTWSVSAGVGTLTIDGDYILDDITITVTAVVDVTTYSVTYADGGASSGSVPTDASDYSSGDEVTVLGKNTLVKTGYAFVGWSDGTTLFLEGQKFNITSDKTLTAVWHNTGTTVTLTHFGTQWRTSAPRRGYGYVGSTSGTKYIIESDNSNNKHTSSDSANIRLNYNSYIKVLGPNATTTLSDSSFTSVSAISFKWKFHGSSTDYTTTVDVYVGNTKVASDMSLTGNKDDDYRTKEITVFPTATGPVRFVNKGSGDSKLSLWLDDIAITYGSGSAGKTVTFDKGSGPSTVTDMPDDIEGITSGLKILQPDDPSAEGYEFEGWVTTSGGSTPFDFANTTITSNTTIYASWSECPERATITSPTTPQSIKLYTDRSKTLTVEATPYSSGTLQYQWKKDGVNIVGATSASHTVYGSIDGTVGESYVYTCEVTQTSPDACATVTSPAFTIKIASPDCGQNIIAEAVLNSTSTASTLTGGTLLQNGLDGSGPYKLNGKPSWFGIKMSSNFQVGDSIIFKLKVGDWWSGASAASVPIVVFSGKSLTKEIYRTAALAKGTDNTYVRFAVTQEMIADHSLTDTVMIWRSTTNDPSCTECCTQNHQMYSVQVKRYGCPDIFIYDDAAATHEWSDDDNWIGPAGHGSGLPTSDDRVLINESITVDTEDAAAAEVHLASEKTMTVEKSVTMGDVIVETGATLNVAKDGDDGIELALNSLSLKGGWNSDKTNYDMPRVYINPDSKITREVSTINFDISVDNRNYYPIALPFDVPLNSVDYAESYIAEVSEYGTHYEIDEYDGEKRAEYGGGNNNWKRMETGSTLKAGTGYILSGLTVGGKAIIRFPMDVDDAWLAGGEKGTATVSAVSTTKNEILVTAYVKEKGTTPVANKGWNLIGVPFMSCYTTSAGMYDAENVDKPATLIAGRFDYSTGKWTEKDPNFYVTVPTHDFTEFKQSPISEAVLMPGWCFFVQVEETGNLRFWDAQQTTSNSSIYEAPRREQSMPTIKTGIILSGNEASDKTTFLISDKYSAAEYEINADLEKMFGENGYTLATYSLSGDTRLAYNAMSRTDATNVIPIGYRAPAEGEYTFAINPRYAESGDFERIDLIDYETGFVTNLLQSSYTFTSDRTQSDSRFALNVVPQKETPTGLENDANDANGVRKVIIDNKIYIIRGGRMYDATGRMVK